MMTRLSLAVAAATLLAGCATGSGPQDTATANEADPALALQPVNPSGLREMSATEMRANLLHGTYVRDGRRTFAVRVQPSHRISGKAFGGNQGLVVGQGTWVIKNGNQFCTNWQGDFGRQGLTCYTAYRAGKQVVLATGQGRGMSVTLVGGNPYAL
jgi:hypothetical protein